MEKSKNWKRYSFEFISIFVAVISAFALNNWNDNRKDRIAETKILIEISNGLKKDLVDVEQNEFGHKQGIHAVQFFRNLLKLNKEVSNDSLMNNYLNLTRDFFSIQNTSGYETLKSKGLEIIENDSLRSRVIGLYETDYVILKKFEEDYYEAQFQENYFKELNELLAPNFIFDDENQLVGIQAPLEMAENKKKLFLTYLWKIEVNRSIIIGYYSHVKENIHSLIIAIENELEL